MAGQADRATNRVSGDEPSEKERLAVFDADGTLFRWGLLSALTRRLVGEEISEDYYAWVERRGSYEGYDKLVVELFSRVKPISLSQDSGQEEGCLAEGR